MVNINIPIPDDVHKKVKLAAVLSETTVKDFIISKLDAALRERTE